MYRYPANKISGAVFILSTVIASMLPISSIVILYFVNGQLKKLYIVAAFTGFFAFCLLTTTGAKVSEIFAATSA